MTGQIGDSARRLLAAFFALSLLVASLPGTNWTAVPADPDLSPGDYALVQVTHGTAGAVAAKATAAGATDVAALDKLDLVTARLSADALRSLQSDSRGSYLAADAVVEANGRENHFEQGKARPSPGVQVVDADQAWSGATGRGVTVALMDTGIAQHPDLEGSVIARLDFVNDGATLLDPSGHDGPAQGTVAMPGADPFVITVGSFADQGTLATNDDRESIFSSRGPTRDGFAKPDVLAPGEHIVSLRIPGTALDREATDTAPAGPYARLTGTSASTAMATGAAADVLEAHRAYSPTQVKGALVAGGRRIVGTRTPGLDVDDALTVRPARVTADLLPSRVLLRLLAASGNVFGPGLTWEGISWEGISWESVSWEGVAWESVSWEGVTWDSVTWELR